MTDTDIHSCGYYCDRPLCIKAQRDELRNKMFSDQAIKTYSGGKPNYTQPEPTGWVGYFEGRLVSFLQNQGQVNEFLQNTEPVGQVFPVYTNPPKKEWVGFTAEDHQSAIWTDGSFGAGFLHAEKLLKEKNT